jgi:hypothetical protein
MLFYFGFLFASRTGLSFRRYLVIADDAYSSLNRISCDTASRCPLVFYRPLVVVYGGSVFVKNHGELYQCRTKREACSLWAYLVLTKYAGKLEDGKCVKEFCSFASIESEEERESRERLESYSANVQRNKTASAVDFKTFSER